MTYNIFIGALLGVIAYFISIDLAIIIGIFLLLTNPRIKVNRVKPVPLKRIPKVSPEDVEQYSDNIIGTYMDNPIHEFVVLKNPADGISYRYDYFDIIGFNARGEVTTIPEAGDAFMSTGLIYKDTGVVVQSNQSK